MSRENLEQVQRLSSAFNSRDLDELLELIDSDVEWIPIMAALEGRVYRGHDGVRQWVEDLSVDWDYFETHQEEFREIGDRVLVFGRWRARARSSGIELENERASWVMDLQDGKIVRLQTYTDRDEAVKAAGLSKSDIA
jgi:ketosteroid isomerase-like protein